MTKYERAKDTALISSICALCAAPFGMAPLALGLGAWYVIKEIKEAERYQSTDKDKDQ